MEKFWSSLTMSLYSSVGTVPTGFLSRNQSGFCARFTLTVSCLKLKQGLHGTLFKKRNKFKPQIPFYIWCLGDSEWSVEFCLFTCSFSH